VAVSSAVKRCNYDNLMKYLAAMAECAPGAGPRS